MISMLGALILFGTMLIAAVLAIGWAIVDKETGSIALSSVAIATVVIVLLLSLGTILMKFGG